MGTPLRDTIVTDDPLLSSIRKVFHANIEIQYIYIYIHIIASSRTNMCFTSLYRRRVSGLPDNSADLKM